MLSIAFYYQGNLVQREVMSAFRKLPGVRLCAIEIAMFTTREQAESACRLISEQGCGILVTINDWGLDVQGYTSEYLHQHRIVHLNWYVDDPFYYEITAGIEFKPRPNRIDFVSDRGYVKPLQEKGLCAEFLPLATDTDIFRPIPDAHQVRNVCFVGNSYREDMDKLLEKHDTFIEEHLPFMKELLGKYSASMQHPIEKEIGLYLQDLRLPDQLSFEKAAFLMKHFVGYLFRKQMVTSLYHRYPDFVVFGDALWVHDLPKEKVSAGVGYYKNLSETYQQTRINIDINRMVIRDGFTQRVFDCLASGAFLITSPKPVVGELFVTSGPNKELVVFQTRDHLHQLIDYYLEHENERVEIARRGREKVLSAHTYDHRVRHMLLAVRRKIT